MLTNNTFPLGYVAPSLLGEGGGRGSFNWSKLLKIIIAVLTALAGALGIASCSAKNDNVNENENRENVSLQIHNSQLMAHRS